MGAPKGNLFALGCKGAGGPPVYNDPVEVQQKCAEYFEWAKEEKQPLTMTGLAIYLGFASRQSLYDMGKRKEFSYIIKCAMQIVENGYESRLSGMASAGAMFALKNMGWTDRCDIDFNGSMNTNSSINEMTFEEIYMLKYGRKPDDSDGAE